MVWVVLQMDTVVASAAVWVCFTDGCDKGLGAGIARWLGGGLAVLLDAASWV